MSEHKEHITQYSAADIQRYVQGKLSAREMHAMEKAALDDPFLADAIEGMQQAFEAHDEQAVTGPLQELKHELQARTAQKSGATPVVSFKWWRVAAAAVVLIIAGVWIYTLVSSPSEKAEQNLAVVKTQEPTEQQSIPAPAAVPNENKTSATADSAITQTYTNAVTDHSNTGNKHTKDTKAVAATTHPAPSAAAASSLLAKQQKNDTATQSYSFSADVAKADQQQPEEKREAPAAAAARAPGIALGAAKKVDDALAYKERETELITIARNDSPAKAKFPADKNLSGVIKGRVIDQNNNPIANAYLQITNNRSNYYNNYGRYITDKTGSFNIPASDSVVDVAVNVTGYTTQNFRLQNNATVNQLQLQPTNMALNEVVVTSIKARKVFGDRKQPLGVMKQDAEPVYGWVAFDQYLEKNKKIPAGDTPVTGNVVVSFEVNKNGDLNDIKIDQSLAKAYDDEAIRLIKQGPAWKLLKGRKARVTVIVKF